MDDPKNVFYLNHNRSLKYIFILGPSVRSPIKSEIEAAQPQSGQMELTTSSSFNATALTTTTTTSLPSIVKKRQRHPAKVDERSSRKAHLKKPEKPEKPESLKIPKPETSLRTVPPRHLVNRTFLLPSGEILAPISFFPGSGQSRMRWDDAASTMLNMTLVFLKNFSEVII